MSRAALPRLAAAAALCIAVPALVVDAPAHAEPPDPRPAIHRSASGVLTYDDPRQDGRRTRAVKGTVETMVKESFRDHDSEVLQSVATADGDLVPVSTRGGASLPDGGRFVGKVVVTGTEVQPVAEATVTPAAAAAAPAPGAHTAYVAVPTAPGAPTMAPSSVSALVGEITTYWIDNSKTSSGTSIISSFPTGATAAYSSANAGACLSGTNHNALWAEAAGKFPGVTFDDATPNHLIVILPNCGGGGLGTVGDSLSSGGRSIVAVQNGIGFQVGAHEIGHNVGLGHANLEHCDTNDTACAIEEYGNAYSVMSSALASANPPKPPALDSVFRKALELSDASEVRPVTLPYGAFEKVRTVVRLAPREATAGTRALEVTDPVTGRKLLVEYRSGSGRDGQTLYARGTFSEELGDDDTKAPFRPGVVVSRLADSGASSGPVNLLMTERISDQLVQTSIRPDDVVPFALDNIEVDVEAATPAAGADVAVTLDAPFLPSSTQPTMSSPVQVDKPVTVNPGTWGSATLSYQWLLDGVPIPGATSNQYTPAAAGGQLSVRVTGQQAGYRTAVRTSASVVVAPGAFSAPIPRIVGTAQVGRTLTALRGTWSPDAASYSYRWLVDGQPIAGATSKTYVIPKSRIGKRISVRVTGSRAEYATTSKTSARTTYVKR
ncbi:M12 family metallo-peptidase [Aeromicrobium sp. NPDC092404]|uniref:M12 family metallo-peptidase n=1 Tax=Aeromicrobium sp. NPDC092404 TaxID=3154976 RepID=UPI003427885D